MSSLLFFFQLYFQDQKQLLMMLDLWVAEIWVTLLIKSKGSKKDLF